MQTTTYRAGPCAGALLTVGMCALMGAARAQQAPGSWAFNPPRDTFDTAAFFDMRSLNEAAAGEHGFLKLSQDGSDIVLGNGQPMRIWAACDYTATMHDDALLAHHARWLAKRGINMVRAHVVLANSKEGAKITDVNEESVKDIWRLVAAMKTEGIYTTISPYWAFGYGNLPASWGVAGGAQSPAGLLFFDKTLQTGYKAWVKYLYATPNPDTGKTLAQDPAVGIVQIQNEDSLLFWTTQSIKGDQLTNLQTLFGDFLKKKYASLDAAKTAWAGEARPEDDFANGRVGIALIWDLTQNQSGGKAARIADQVQFFTETMANFNTEMTRYLREDLGCKQLINAGNWRTADSTRLYDAERWSYMPTEVMGVNRYFGGIHDGQNNGWALQDGQNFTNASCLTDPPSLPVNLKQVVGRPFIISESQWVPPTAWQSEGPFLTAAYESLTGQTAFYWFCLGDYEEWQLPQHPPINGWQPPVAKWVIGTPMQMGQFPAAAWMFRNGFIKRGGTAVHEERALEDMWQRRIPIIAEESGFDPNRDTGNMAPRSSIKGGVDPLAFLVGRVEVKYAGDPAKSTTVDLKKYIDRDAKTIKSLTGELLLNWGDGLCTLNTPMAQGVCGFLNKRPRYNLDTISLTSTNEYASVLAVAYDKLPLSRSKKVLVQVGTVARPTGWQDEDATFTSDGKSVNGKRIVHAGGSPWQITNTQVTVSIKNPLLRSARLLDVNGMPVSEIAVSRVGGVLTVKLPADALYVGLQDQASKAAALPAPKQAPKQVSKPAKGAARPSARPKARPSDNSAFTPLPPAQR